MLTELLVLYLVEDNLNLKLEEFNRLSEKHIGIINEWWANVSDHSFSQEKQFSSFLSTDHGFMVWDEDKPICAVFLYPIYGSPVAIMGFPISNQNAFKEVRRKALELLVAGVEKKARSLHYALLFGYAGNTVAKEFYGRAGFMKAAENITNFIKKL